MNLENAVEMVKSALKHPISTWLDYSPVRSPFVIYDDHDFDFIHHPNPPSERPAQLTAATAVEINGVLTATIPLWMCTDEQSLIPLVYHEGFHVYQGTKFQFAKDFDFFEVLAFYPELNPTYRALCSAETDILNDSLLSPLEKAKLLSAVIGKRHEILAQRKGLLAFEKNLERNEGTAMFVEQKARQILFGISPELPAGYFGYSRQYFVGPAICQLLDQISSVEEWKNAVVLGQSISEFLIETAPPEQTDWAKLGIATREAVEKQNVDRILAEANQKMENLLTSHPVILRLPRQARVSRSFSPRSIVALGDGRLIHPEFVVIQIPNGKISIQGQMTVENYVERTVMFNAILSDLVDHRLELDSENVKISLEQVRPLPDGSFELF
ncbi:MAG: hypothetical protein H6636_03225 [Anaerolineales bacterium]|nr:hypothetical protein [Anaerolineales bacterium]